MYSTSARSVRAAVLTETADIRCSPPQGKSVLSEVAAPTLESGGLYVSAYPFRVVGISALSLCAVISHCFVLVTHTPLDVLGV